MIQITNNSEALASFDEPLRLLGDCHRRIEKFLGELIDVTNLSATGRLSPDSRERLSTAIRYFDQGVPLHNADEEDSLFGPLSQAAPNVKSVIDTLADEHRAMELRHSQVKDICTQWLLAGTLSSGDRVQLMTLLLEMRSAYDAHIRVEDHQLLPLAGEVMNKAQLDAIGRAMASRRGLDYDKLPASGRCAARRLVANHEAMR